MSESFKSPRSGWTSGQCILKLVLCMVGRVGCLRWLNDRSIFGLSLMSWPEDFCDSPVGLALGLTYA